MAYSRHATFDTLRESLYSSITGSYTTAGAALTSDARMIQFVNSTDKDLYLSIDGSSNYQRVASGTNQEIDFTTNKVDEEGFFFPLGTQFYVKQTEAGAPTKGSMAIQVVHASPPP